MADALIGTAVSAMFFNGPVMFSGSFTLSEDFAAVHVVSGDVFEAHLDEVTGFPNRLGDSSGELIVFCSEDGVIKVDVYEGGVDVLVAQQTFDM